MKLLKSLIGVLPLLQLAASNFVNFDDGSNSQVCAGIYSKHDWGGSIKPQIQLTLEAFGKDKFDPKKANDHKEHTEPISLTYVIFEYRDIGGIGLPGPNGFMKYICDDVAIEEGLCDQSQKYTFILNNQPRNATILTAEVLQLGPAHIEYPINKTGYYCVSTFTHGDFKYKGHVNFQNAFGHLSASEIPKLPAYGILTLCYAIALALFGFQFFKKRKENQILPLQRYLLAMIGFLTFDTIVVWSYYDLVNRTKSPHTPFVTFYMSFLSLLNAAKITFSFFLLLCIGLGYGVVKLKLNKKVMLKCKILAGVHFVASIVYLLASYYTGQTSSTSSSANIDEDSFGGLLGILPLIPVTITLCVYYVAILVSIRATTASLHAQRQVIKLQLYEKLFRIIFFSVVLTIAGFSLSSVIFLGMSSTDIVESHWKAAFFVFEFWPSVIFFFVFMGIAWLWRPTETSYMLAVSQQLSGGDDLEDGEEGNGGSGYHQGHEFELDDLSLMSHSDNEQEQAHGDEDSFELRDAPQNGSGSSTDQPPQYDELDKKNKKSIEEDEPVEETGNTLFEVGEGDDDSDHDRTDDRLN